MRIVGRVAKEVGWTIGHEVFSTNDRPVGVETEISWPDARIDHSHGDPLAGDSGCVELPGTKFVHVNGVRGLARQTVRWTLVAIENS